MKSIFLVFVFILLNIYLIVAQQITLKQQCEQLVGFINKINIKYETKQDNCCNIPRHIECGQNNLVSQVGIFFDKRQLIQSFDFPAIPTLTYIGITNILFGNVQLPSTLFQPNLEKFELTNSDITSIPKEIENLSNLKILDLSTNKIREVPNLRNFNKLETLRLYGNDIESIEIKDITSKNFTYLDLGVCRKLKNSNAVFQEITENLKELVRLNIEWTNLSKIPQSISNLKKLEILDLKRNKISVLPEEMRLLTNLKDINLSSNDILYGVFNLEHVDKCNLDKTNICVLNDQVCTTFNGNQTKICTEEEISYTKKMQNEIYKINTNEDGNENSSTKSDEKSNESKNDTSFFTRNKLIIISIVIAVLLVISFLIFFCFNKAKNEEPIFIKDDNNATYAYSNDEHSRQIINKLNLNNSKIEEEKDKNINEVSTTNFSITQTNNAYITPNPNVNSNYSTNNLSYQNNCIGNNVTSPQLIGNAGISNNSFSQLSPQLSPQVNPQLVNGIGDTSILQLSPQINPQLVNGIGGTTILQLSPQLINNVGSSSSIPQMSPQLISNVSNTSTMQHFNNSQINNDIDDDRIKLQAKIQKEMLATEEKLINKKAKAAQDDYDQLPPPYSD